MSGEVWIPGTAAAQPPSVEDFIKRVHAQIQVFAKECKCERAVVEVLLHDGRRLRLHSLSPEPGLGWVTLRPFPDDDEKPLDAGEDTPVRETLMLPLQSIVRIVMRSPEEEEQHPFGFVTPEDEEDV